jgi:hypothetical protein
MFKKIAMSTAIAAAALTALPAAAEAQSRYGYSSRYDNGYYNQRYYGQAYANQRYYSQRTYNQGYYRHYGRRCSGSTGTIIGAIAGGLLGSEIGRGNGYYGRRGSGTTGAIVGGALGALTGRAIDRSDCRYR